MKIKKIRISKSLVRQIYVFFYVSLQLTLYFIPFNYVSIASEDKSFSFKVDVTLINITVTVTDKEREYITDLKKEDFRVYEDGVSQETTFFNSGDIPVSVGILLDTSGSMVDKLPEAKDAIEHFAKTINPQDDLFLSIFNNSSLLVQDFTSDRSELTKALGWLDARGYTALYDTIFDGLNKIKGGKHKKKALVLITDGNDTSSYLSLVRIQRYIKESEVLLYSIGIGHSERGSYGHGVFSFNKRGDEVDANTLSALSEETGGRAFIMKGAHIVGGIDVIDRACQEIAKELRYQYSLGYISSNEKRDGKWRYIKVKVVSRDNLKVRARKGYFAPED